MMTTAFHLLTTITCVLLLMSGVVFAEDSASVVKQACIFRTVGTVDIISVEGSRRRIIAPRPAPEKSTDPHYTQPGKEEDRSPIVLPGETIATGDKAYCDVLLPEIGTLRVDPNSRLRIPPLAKRGEKIDHSVEHVSGRTLFSVDKREEEDSAKSSEKTPSREEFRIKTPRTILGIRGTRLFAESKEDFDAIGVHEGKISTQENVSGKKVALEAGMVCYARAEQLTEPRALSPEQKALAGVYGQFEMEAVGLNLNLAAARHEWEVAGRGGWRTSLQPIDGGFRWSIPRAVPEGLGADLKELMGTSELLARRGPTDPMVIEVKVRARAVTGATIATAIFPGQEFEYVAARETPLTQSWVTLLFTARPEAEHELTAEDIAAHPGVEVRMHIGSRALDKAILEVDPEGDYYIEARVEAFVPRFGKRKN